MLCLTTTLVTSCQMCDSRMFKVLAMGTDNGYIGSTEVSVAVSIASRTDRESPSINSSNSSLHLLYVILFQSST